jgi:hypothetical protein
MKEGDFSSFVGAKAMGFSERHFDLVVQAFDDAARNGFLGAEVEQHLPMPGQGGGDGLERFEAGTADAPAPAV